MSVTLAQRPRLRGKCAPGIKRCVLAEMRRVLVEHAECNTAEAWGGLADVATATAKKYLEWMVAHDEAVAHRHGQSDTRSITLYEAVS